MGEARLVFSPPGRHAPGFLRRMRQAAVLERKLAKDVTLEVVDEMVEFLLDFIVEPQDRQKAEELLWEASQDDFEAMLGTVTGASVGEDDGETEAPKVPTEAGHINGVEA